jgi:hypothetical protein
MEARQALRWSSVSRDALAWRELEHSLVVRNAHSGNTHLLEPPASRVLLALIDADHGLPLAELATRLREDSAATIEALLAEFQRLGLAEARTD